jgi:hypothetical protein
MVVDAGATSDGPIGGDPIRAAGLHGRFPSN